MLAIEVDGMSHDNEEAFEKDNIRQQKSESFGISFLRFTEAEVKRDRLNVIRVIEGAILNILKRKPDVELPKGFDKGLLDI